jgi:hypothetical protein
VNLLNIILEEWIIMHEDLEFKYLKIASIVEKAGEWPTFYHCDYRRRLKQNK